VYAIDAERVFLEERFLEMTLDLLEALPLEALTLARQPAACSFCLWPSDKDELPPPGSRLKFRLRQSSIGFARRVKLRVSWAVRGRSRSADHRYHLPQGGRSPLEASERLGGLPGDRSAPSSRAIAPRGDRTGIE
jgi:hypothetical protein